MDKKFDKNPNTVEKTEWLYLRHITPETERLNDWMFPYLNPLIKKDESDILEVGCGFGKTLAIINQKCNLKAKLLGIDISETAVTKSKQYYNYIKNMEVIWGNFEEYQSIYNDRFDLVICSQTLEHVDNPIIMIKNLKKAVKKGGILFITVPWPKSNLDNGVKTHYWRFYPEDFYGLLKNCEIKRETTRMIVVWKK